MKKKEYDADKIITIIVGILCLGFAGYFLYSSRVNDADLKIEKNSSQALREYTNIYKNVEEIILSRFSNNNLYSYNGLFDKYSIVDINRDGTKEIIYYDIIDNEYYNIYIYKEVENGYYLYAELSNKYPLDSKVIYEEKANYLTLDVIESQKEIIYHLYIDDKNYELKEISSSTVLDEKDYNINRLIDQLIWESVEEYNSSSLTLDLELEKILASNIESITYNLDRYTTYSFKGNDVLFVETLIKDCDESITKEMFENIDASENIITILYNDLDGVKYQAKLFSKDNSMIIMIYKQNELMSQYLVESNANLIDEYYNTYFTEV